MSFPQRFGIQAPASGVPVFKMISVAHNALIARCQHFLGIRIRCSDGIDSFEDGNVFDRDAKIRVTHELIIFWLHHKVSQI